MVCLRTMQVGRTRLQIVQISSHLNEKVRMSVDMIINQYIMPAIYCKESVVRGHHVYKDNWTPSIGDVLVAKTVRRNGNDRCAVALTLHDGAYWLATFPESSPRLPGTL